MTDLDKLEALAKAAGNVVSRKDLERFLSKTKRADNGCLLWTASTSGRPGRMYGCFSVRGKPLKAHRFALLLKQGFLTDGRLACHTCDEHLCVEPSHIYEGTTTDNARDAVERWRQSNGQSEKTHCPKGHPYAAWNTYVYRGNRQCRVCRNIHRGRSAFLGLTPPARAAHTGEG